jgi:hypothetical protein
MEDNSFFKIPVKITFDSSGELGNKPLGNNGRDHFADKPLGNNGRDHFAE